MSFDNLKYGFLISVTTMFGGSSLELRAQTENDGSVPIETDGDYRQHFMESISPSSHTLKVDFVVDSVEQKTSCGDLLADVNIIQLLAYLDENSDEYQSYMASRHIVAHEMWHRVCIMSDVLEKPVSASQYRNGRDNFEITASIVQLLTFREDYLKASPEQRTQLRKLDDPKIRMYVMAAEQGIIKPFSNDKKDFDFEMEFIAKTVSGYWNNNMAPIYAPLHNAMTETSGRKEFSSPQYEKNFTHDILKMNTIGGIDFSKLYNVKDVRLKKDFPKGSSLDSKMLDTSLSTPDYETWINKKSKLKRFSRQKIEIPNFCSNLLVRERTNRPKNEHVQPYRLASTVTGYKTYPLMKIPFYAAVQLQNDKHTVKIYPHGAMDIIVPTDNPAISKVKTVHYDGSIETGLLKNGRKNGTFVFTDAKKNIIGQCTFINGKAQNGILVLPMENEYIRYIYKDGKLSEMDSVDKSGKIKKLCTLDNGIPVSGLVPATASKTTDLGRTYLVYSDKRLTTGLIFDENRNLNEKQEISFEKNIPTVRIERFYTGGQPKYLAETTLHPASSAEDSHPHLKTSAPAVNRQTKTVPESHISASLKPSTQKTSTILNSAHAYPEQQPLKPQREILFAPEGSPVITALHTETKSSFKVKIKKILPVLKSVAIPPEYKKKLISAILQLSRHTAGQKDDISAEKTRPLSKSLIRRSHSPLPKVADKRTQTIYTPLKKQISNLARQKGGKARKIITLKNKFKFLLTKQKHLSRN